MLSYKGGAYQFQKNGGKKLTDTYSLSLIHILVIDVTASRRRTDANIAFAWAGRFGMVVGLALGIYIYPYWNFHHIIYTSMALGALALEMCIRDR